MTITLNGTPTTTDNAAGTASSSIALAVPTGAVVGEILLAWLAVGTNNGGVTTPTGWTVLVNLNDAGAATGSGVPTSIEGVLAWRAVTGTEAASYTWTTSAAGTKYAANMFRVGGANTTTPFRVTNTASNPAGTTSQAAPTATSAQGVTAADTTLSFWAAGDGSSVNQAATYTAPAGYTAWANRGVSSKGTVVALNNTAGPTATGPTVSGGTAQDCWVVATVAIVAGGTTLAGVTATAAASAPAGALTADTNLAGPVATAAASAPAGGFTSDITLSGPVATATATAPAGSVLGGVNVQGAVATVAATAPAGTALVWPLPVHLDQAVLATDGTSQAVLLVRVGAASLAFDGSSTAALTAPTGSAHINP